MSGPAIEIENLSKTFRLGLGHKPVQALKKLSLKVEVGEVCGFLGPNGAGKTTTLKMLTGLMFPSSGSVRLFGQTMPNTQVLARVGYLPENPYFYDYLTGPELLDFFGSLAGLSRAQRKRKTEELLVLVGLEGRADRPLRRYSKGMKQRLGLAQALIHDPELIVLDEPMSGLDPIGRREVRNIIYQLKTSGKTIFMSTHILSDLEMICNRAVLIARGELLNQGSIEELLQTRVLSHEIVLRKVQRQQVSWLEPLAHDWEELGGDLLLHVGPQHNVQSILQRLLQQSVEVVSLRPIHDSLEDLFMREVKLQAQQQAEGAHGRF